MSKKKSTGLGDMGAMFNPSQAPTEASKLKPKKVTLESDKKVKATFYIRQSVLDQLEDVEVKLRFKADREKRKGINKSTIVETALILAMSDFDEDEDGSDLVVVMALPE